MAQRSYIPRASRPSVYGPCEAIGYVQYVTVVIR